MQTVATVVADGAEPFEFGVVCEVFGAGRPEDGGPSFDHHIVTEHPGMVRTNQGFGISVEEDLTFAYTADVVVVTPFWQGGGPEALSPAVADVIRAAEERGAWLISVCTGAFTLAQAGVLDGRHCTTHWRYAQQLAEQYPDTVVDPDVLYVEDRHVITSAGTAAGIDACLHLVRREHGVAAANVIARRMVVPPQREGGQCQYIATPLPMAQSDSLSPITEWMLQRLGDDLTVEKIADKAHMSARTFARRFHAELGTTPKVWLNRQRLLRAQELLEKTDLDLERVAQQSGFSSSALLRQHFSVHLKTTPTAYRSTFSCADDA